MNEVEKVLKEVFHLRYLKPSQETIITRILENSRRKEEKDSITVLPTGAGKSLCFMVPAVLFKKRYTIIIYPLLALMNDQGRKLSSLGIPYSMIKGGMTPSEKRRELEKLRTLSSQILITNIESLTILTERHQVDFMRGMTELFVIDEAHTAVTWAEDFRPAFKNINPVTQMIRPHQRLCFTATADENIMRGLLREVLKNEDADILRLSSDRGNICYTGIRTLCRRADIKRILKEQQSRPAVVFCSYRNETIEYYELFKDTFPSFYYHAGLERDVKVRMENNFLKSEDGVIFATNAYGMGVDKKNIRTVIHLHAPEDAASFLQEAGRGGRDGKAAGSFVLYTRKDRGKLRYVFDGKDCIRATLLHLMGEEGENGCLSCSKCLKADESAAGERDVMETVRRFPFFFTKNTLSWILKHTKLREWRKKEIERALQILIDEGAIKLLLKMLYVPRHMK